VISLDPSQLVGSYPPLVTPFADGRVDLAAYERLVDRQVADGSQGIVICGTTGEPSLLRPSERTELVRVAVSATAGRIPVVAATGSASYDETRVLCEEAVAAGADALLVVTPYYLRPPQRGLVEYYCDLGSRFDLPFLIYHIPGRAAVTLEPESLAAIAERTPNLVGMKHAATDLALITQARALLGPDFRVFVGLEELSLPMLAVGSHGLMNAVGNLVPGRVAALCQAVAEGRLADARAIHDALWELNRSIFFDMNPIPIKYMMRRIGLLEVNEHRLPMMPATPELEKRLDGVLERAGLLPEQAEPTAVTAQGQVRA
jgi:4-hydroxy-tetrahydrodipicolinate synthase